MQVEESYRDWLKRVDAEGAARGEARGRAEGLLQVLSRRFGDVPPDVVARIPAASIAELEQLTDRALGEATLEAVLLTR